MKAALLTRLRDAVAAGRSCAVVTDTATGRQAMVADGASSGELELNDAQRAEVRRLMAADRSALIEGTTLFVRTYATPPKVVIVGAVHIAQSLVPMAQLAGFAVTVVDPRSAFVKSGNFSDVTAIEAWPDEAMSQIALDPRTAVVTLTHDPKLDDPALAAALRAPVFYIGALGSRKTHAKRLQRLKDEGFTDDEVARVKGPVGLDINAMTPAEIAVSIIAELIQVLRKDTE